jgi:Holliday junction DNA helicase RuvB
MPKETPEQLNNDDRNLELTLRPTKWGDYVGQEKIKDNLRLIMQAAKERKETCDHILFYGQAGLGKTTLAYLMGKEMSMNVRATSGPALEKTGDIAAILSNMEPHEILFIDEAHRINKLAEEIMYPALEARKLHLIIGKGPSARTLTLDLPPFTVIAATTRASLISNPLRSRFGAIFRLDYYKIEDIEKIIKRSSDILGVKITPGAITKLALASRFTPRVANRLLKRTRDYAQVHKRDEINEEVVGKTLKMLEIDELGLEAVDRNLLEIVIKRFNGGPVGLRALSAALNEDLGTIEEVYEPFLMSLGFLERTQLGRVATRTAYKYLDLPLKATLL